MYLARRAGLVPCQRGRLGLGREVDGIVRHLQIKRRAGVGLMTDELHGVVGEGAGLVVGEDEDNIGRLGQAGKS